MKNVIQKLRMMISKSFLHFFKIVYKYLKQNCSFRILPRMIVSPTDNILLIVKDISKGAKNTEKSEEYHKELLEKHNVKIKPEVMCLTRLRKEHDQFELKRKLVNSYETFLVDGRISGHLAHFLGKIFTKKRKLPTPIKMDAENLDEQITKGLRRTILPLHSTGDCYTLRIGTTNMPTKHITENFLAACTQIAKLFPGGWDNVRCIRLKTPLSMALPIYVSLSKFYGFFCVYINNLWN